MKHQAMKLSVLVFLGLGVAAYGQYDGKVGVNTETPKATLEVTISKANENANTKEGILIPRVTAARAEAMGGDVEESTLVYITDGTAGANYTSQVAGKGFYYFDKAAQKWVKIGGSTGGAITNNGSMYRGIRVLTNIKASEWLAEDFTIVLTNGLTDAALPDPKTNVGRVISIRNASQGLITYTANSPLNNSAISMNRGQLIQSDGKNWYVIGGF